MFNGTQAIQMHVRVPRQSICIIDFGAELSIQAEEALWQAYSQIASREDTGWVLLNFSATNDIDSAGIGLITLLLIQAEKDGLKFGAFGLTRHYRNIFVITQLDQVIKIFETEADAFIKIESEINKSPETSVSDESSILDILVLDEIIEPSVENSPWAKPVERLKVAGFPKEAINLNVEGRKLAGPFQGFGQLWHKTFRIRLEDQQLSPAETIQIWKQNLPKLKPAEKRFYPSPAGIQPGEIILINASTPGGPISTGVMVLYSGKNSFTLITPQGHPEAGWVTFSAYKDNLDTILQVDVLARSSDPLYELAFRLAGTNVQDRIWTHVLTSLAEHLNTQGEMQVIRRLVDANLRWKNAGNIRYNAQIFSILHLLLTPFRWIIAGAKNFFKSSENSSQDKPDQPIR